MTSHRRPNYRRIRRTSGLAAVAVLATGGSGLAFASTAQAAALNVFDLSAEAVALNSTTTDPNIPLGIPFVVGSYGASSRLNSNGDSVADAGAPYSPLVYSLPSTGNGIMASSFGFGFPTPPTFPGYVVAKDPVTPAGTQNAGGYQLTATADPHQAIGKVGLGAQSATAAENNFFAYASNTAGADGVLSAAAAGVHALTLDGIVDIANVSTHASLAEDSSGVVTPSLTTDLGTISFAGLNSGLTGGGVTAFGTKPTPISTDNLDQLNAALAPSGVSLAYLPALFTYSDGSTSTGDVPDSKKAVAGLVSGALRVVLSNTSARGATTETITIGRVHLTAAGKTVGVGAATPAGVTGTAAPVNAPSGFVAAGPQAALPPALSGSVLPSPALPVSAVPTAADSTVADGVPTVTFAPAAASTVLREGTTDLGSAYLVLAGVGALALVGAQSVRLLAVRGR